MAAPRPSAEEIRVVRDILLGCPNLPGGEDFRGKLALNPHYAAVVKLVKNKATEVFGRVYQLDIGKQDRMLLAEFAEKYPARLATQKDTAKTHQISVWFTASELARLETAAVLDHITRGKFAYTAVMAAVRASEAKRQEQ